MFTEACYVFFTPWKTEKTSTTSSQNEPSNSINLFVTRHVDTRLDTKTRRVNCVTPAFSEDVKFTHFQKPSQTPSFFFTKKKNTHSVHNLTEFVFSPFRYKVWIRWWRKCTGKKRRMCGITPVERYFWAKKSNLRDEREEKRQIAEKVKKLDVSRRENPLGNQLAVSVIYSSSVLKVVLVYWYF